MLARVNLPGARVSHPQKVKGGRVGGLVSEWLQKIERGLRIAPKDEATGKQVCRLTVLRVTCMQLPKIGQRMSVVILLEVSESKIEENARIVWADRQGPPVNLNGACVSVSAGIDDAEIPQCANCCADHS